MKVERFGFDFLYIFFDRNFQFLILNFQLDFVRAFLKKKT